jgi:hypothetical protein
MMAWAYFQNQAAFDLYHNKVCTDLGIPLPGRIQSDQSPAILNQWTDSFIAPTQIKSQGNVTTWAARIPDSHVIQYAAQLGLTTPDSSVVFNIGANGLPDGTVTIQGQGTYAINPNTLTYKKTKPPTYTMDGHVYDTATGQIIG